MAHGHSRNYTTLTDATKLYELIAAGEIETVKLGKSTRITTASLHNLVRRQREAG